MTYEKMKAEGAEIIPAGFSVVPTDGWTEISIDQLREMNNDSSASLNTAKTAAQHGLPERSHHSSSAALEKAERGERIFYVRWHDELIFAAIKEANL